MATQLFLTSAASPLGGSGQLALSTTRGSVSTTAVTTTVAGGTSIPVTGTAGGTAVSWWYRVGAGTISGNITANIRGKEATTTSVNAGAALTIDLYQSDGTTLIGNMLTSAVPSTITEYSTSDAAKALASTALTSQKATNGCWVKVTLYVRNAGGTMAAGTVTNTYNGPTSGSAGDTYVTFATTLPAYAAPNTGMAYVAATGVPVSGSSSSLSMPVPLGVTSGDLVIISLGAEWNSTTLPDTTSVTASGFTVAQVSAYQSYTNFAETAILLYKYATAADSGSYSVTFNTVGGAGVTAVSGVASIVRGGPTSGNPFTDTFQSTHSVGSQTATVSSFTPTDVNSLLIASVWCNDGVSVNTFPSGWVNQANGSSGNGMMLTTLQQTSPAATGSLTWAMASGSPDPVVLIGTIRLLVAPTTITPASITVQNGTPLSVMLGSDGVPTPTYSVTAGALPGGLTLSGGVISGTPTDSGGSAYSFTITATNSKGSTTKTYSGSVAADPLAPIIVASYAGAGHGNVTSQTVTVQTGDLIIATAYMEPNNEATSSASYGTITPPSGFTLIPSPLPASSNDANLTSQNTQRSYVAYKWITTNGTITVTDWGYGSNWYEFDSIIQIRGATDQYGTTLGVPYQEIATASQGTTNTTAFPGVSLTAPNAHSTLLFIGTMWSSGTSNSLSGWYQLNSNGTGVAYVNTLGNAGNTGTIAPTVASTNLLTSVLLSFRKVIAPIAAYSLDEGSGTIVHDVTGNGNNFTLTDTTKWSVTGKNNGSLGSGAGTSYATQTLATDFSAGTQPFTAMMWVYPSNTTQSDSGLIGNTALDLEYTTGQFYGDGFGTTVASYPANTWTHVAWVADGSNKITYVNGVNVLSTSGAPPGGWGSGASIGLTGTNDTSLFVGNVDDVRIFTAGLSASDVAYFMNTPVTTPVYPPSISTTMLNPMASGTAFLQNLVATGSPTITWSVASGTLPTGITLSSSGILSGTPSAVGTYSFTVTATNSSSVAAQTYSVTVAKASRLVRNKTVFQTSGTTNSATFDETVPLDSTYLLIATIHVNSSTVVATPSGWTALNGNGNNSSVQVRMFAKQGDGVTNSVSFTVPSSSSTLSLAAYSGFSSLTPIDTDGGESLSGGTSFTTAITAGIETGYGVLIQAVGVSGVVTWNDWTVLSRLGPTTGSTALVSASQLLTVASAEFIGTDGTPSYGVSWTTSRSGRSMGVIMPLTTAIPSEVASYSLDENTGTTAADSSGNGLTATVSNWTTGHTNSGANGDSTHTAMNASGTFVSSPTTVTVMGWFNPTSGFTGKDLLMLSSNSTNQNSNRLGIGFPSGTTTPYAWIYNSGANFSSATAAQSLSVGTWYHLAAVLDTSTISLYLNGVLVASSLWSGSIGSALAYLDAGGITPYNEYNVGTVDDIRVYSQALSQWQINHLANTPVPAAIEPASSLYFLKTSTSLVPLFPYLKTSSGLISLSASSSRASATYRWTADTLSLSNGAEILSWPDEVSGQLLTATTGNAPTYLINATNSKPAAHWPTTSSTAILHASGLTVLNAPFTFITVVNTTDATPTRQLFYWSLEAFIDGGPEWVMWSSYGELDAPTSTATSGWHILTMIINGSSSAFYIDGTLMASGTIGLGGTSSTGSLGGHPSEGRNWRGDIAYFALYPTALSAGDRATEHSALGDEYGISVSDHT